MIVAVSSLAHDLRTPLNAIRTWVAVLDAQLAQSEDPIVHQALAGILKGIEQQARLIEDLAQHEK